MVYDDSQDTYFNLAYKEGKVQKILGQKEWEDGTQTEITINWLIKKIILPT